MQPRESRVRLGQAETYCPDRSSRTNRTRPPTPFEFCALLYRYFLESNAQST